MPERASSPSRQRTAEGRQCAQALGAGDAGGVATPGASVPSESDDETDRQRDQYDGGRRPQHPGVG